MEVTTLAMNMARLPSSRLVIWLTPDARQASVAGGQKGSRVEGLLWPRR